MGDARRRILAGAPTSIVDRRSAPLTTEQDELDRAIGQLVTIVGAATEATVAEMVTALTETVKQMELGLLQHAINAAIAADYLSRSANPNRQQAEKELRAHREELRATARRRLVVLRARDAIAPLAEREPSTDDELNLGDDLSAELGVDDQEGA